MHATKTDRSKQIDKYIMIIRDFDTLLSVNDKANR